MHNLNDMMQVGCTTERGVRFWEEKGLLGIVERTNGGVRRYSPAQLIKAKIIAAAKFAGWELDEIKPMLESYGKDVHDALLYRLSTQAELALRLIDDLPPVSDPQEYDL